MSPSSKSSSRKRTVVKTMRERRTITLTSKSGIDDVSNSSNKSKEVEKKNKVKNALEALKEKRKQIAQKHVDPKSTARLGRSSRLRASTRNTKLHEEDEEEFIPPRVRSIVIKVAARVTSLAEVLAAFLTRSMIASILHAPFFTATLVGAFVRLAETQFNGKNTYVIWQIIAVKEEKKVYALNKKATNKYILCKRGSEQRQFRLNFVSNSLEIRPMEFVDWLVCCKQNGNVPTVDAVTVKKTEIQEALTHRYIDSEIEEMVKEKKTFQKGPINLAVRKANLLKQLEMAAQSGDALEAMYLQDEIQKIDCASEERDKKLTKNSPMVALMNQRRAEKKMENSFKKETDARKGLRIMIDSNSKISDIAGYSENVAEIVLEQSEPLNKNKKTSANVSRFHDFDVEIDELLGADMDSALVIGQDVDQDNGQDNRQDTFNSTIAYFGEEISDYSGDELEPEQMSNNVDVSLECDDEGITNMSLNDAEFEKPSAK